MTQPIPPGFELHEKCEELRSALLAQHPRMPVLLAEIYKTLKAQPENVTLLSELDIQAIVQGLIKQTGTEFAKSALKATSKSISTRLKSGELNL